MTPAARAAGLESGAADILAVLEAAESDRPSILDLGYGGFAVFMAAMYPERVRSIILTNLRSSFPQLGVHFGATDRNSCLARYRRRPYRPTTHAFLTIPSCSDGGHGPTVSTRVPRYWPGPLSLLAIRTSSHFWTMSECQARVSPTRKPYLGH